MYNNGFFIALVSLIFTIVHSIFIYSAEKKKETIKMLRSIRVNHPSIYNNNISQAMSYMQEIEFFATGVNEGIYDINIVKKISGSLLKQQYRKWMANYINSVRNKQENKMIYIECEKMINKL